MDYLHVDSLLIESLSLSLLHSLWQGVVVACFAATGFAVLRRSPNLRYLWGTVCLAIFAVCPFVTFGLLHHDDDGSTSLLVASAPVAIATDFVADADDVVAIDMSIPNVSVLSAGELAHMAIVAVWVLGQIFIGCRLLMSACFVHRLKRLSRPIPPELQRVAERLSKRMGMRCPRIASSQQIAGAMAAGLFRQIVVLPTAWLAEMTPEMLEAVIAHELAHVKRYDLWVNLFQRIVESVLFFHPATWWLSARIRRDREFCCDALAVEATSQRKQYAETLEHVARLRADRNLILVTQIGDDRMSLLRRVRFVLGQETSSAKQGWWPAGLLVMAIPCGLMFLGYAVPSLAEEADVSLPPRMESGSVVPASATAASVWEGRVTNASYERNQRATALPHGKKNQVWPHGPYVIDPPDVIRIKFDEPLIPLSENASELTTAAKEGSGGNYLVEPDGTVSFGEHGRVYVSGMEMKEAAGAVKKHLSKHFKDPKVTLDLFTNNSKVYYIINEGAGSDAVFRVVLTGHETVLDAMSNVGGVSALSSSKMWISRPSSGGGQCDQVLPIDWDGITRGANTETNYQLLPGDRVFIGKGKVKGDSTADISEHIRIPIMGPLSSGGQASRIDPPTDKEILKLVRAGAADSELLSRENRNRVVITKELIADYVDPAKNYPLIGPAQMHHAHYKCTVALRVDKGGYVPRHENETEFFVDHHHLHADKELVVRPQEALVDPPPVVNAPAPVALFTRAYHVADLVLPIGAPAFSKTGDVRVKPENAKDDFSTLIDLITTTVMPESWERAGGTCTVAKFEANVSLVISNSQLAHEEIADLLRQLRKLQEVKTVLSATTFELSAGLMKELGLHDKQFAVLTKQEQKRIITAAKDDPHARIYPELKAKLFNGEQVKMKAAGDVELATQFRIGEQNDVNGFAVLGNPKTGFRSTEFTGDQTLLIRMQSDATNSKKPLFRLITAEAVVKKEAEE